MDPKNSSQASGAFYDAVNEKTSPIVVDSSCGVHVGVTKVDVDESEPLCPEFCYAFTIGILNLLNIDVCPPRKANAVAEKVEAALKAGDYKSIGPVRDVQIIQYAVTDISDNDKTVDEDGNYSGEVVNENNK